VSSIFTGAGATRKRIFFGRADATWSNSGSMSSAQKAAGR
jgi:hypothetical protein